MTFIEDVRAALPSTRRRQRYTVTVFGDGAAVIEYSGKPVKVTDDEIVVEVKGARIAVSGETLRVRESGDGQTFVTGKIAKVEVVG